MPKKLTKKEAMWEIYRWGFGDVLNEIFGIVEFVHKYNEGHENIPEIKRLFGVIASHYENIKWIIDQFRDDPELTNVLNVEKRLSELGVLLEKFEKNPSNKTVVKKIFDLVFYLRNEGELFRPFAKKHGAYSGIKELRLKTDL